MEEFLKEGLPRAIPKNSSSSREFMLFSHFAFARTLASPMVAPKKRLEERWQGMRRNPMQHVPWARARKTA